MRDGPRSYLLPVAILAIFCVATVVMLYPLSTNPGDMVPELTDPLLNAWTLYWGEHSLLRGPEGLSNLFNANNFYPYTSSLAFSEHMLGHVVLALPILLLSSGHLLAVNSSVVFSFVLTAYAGYLLISDWTKNRWAGLLAGFLLSFSPYRFGQINHLNLLATHWMLLTILALHWLLTRPRFRYALLFAVFFNLQALSSVNYLPQLLVAVLTLFVVYAAFGRVKWNKGLILGLGASVLVTCILNVPLWAPYIRFSDLMQVHRTPGDVRVYSAALSDFVTTLPHNLLYGWTFGRWQSAGHQFQPLMPVGLVGGGLALVGTVFICVRRSVGRRPWETGGWTLAVLSLVGFVLALGTNENAFGEAAAPWLGRLLPYGWLYEHVPGFTGMRVPARFALLLSIGLAGLAGIGLRGLFGRPTPPDCGCGGSSGPRKWLHLRIVLPFGLLMGVAVVECWSVPLIGPKVDVSVGHSPLYQWLSKKPESDVVLELPNVDESEFEYQYLSTYHWHRLVNGGSGYTPPVYRKMRQWWSTFPDARSVDVIQQLGVNYVVLHRNKYSDEAWQQLQSDLPAYLPSFGEIFAFGEDLVVETVAAGCTTRDVTVAAEVTSVADKGVIRILFENRGPASFVGDVTHPSSLQVDGTPSAQFLEPLVVLPGASEEEQLGVVGSPLATGTVELALATAGLVVADSVPGVADDQAASERWDWQPVTLQFVDGPRLAALALNPSVFRPCSLVQVGIEWADGGERGDWVVLQLIDRYGRTVLESQSHPWTGADGVVRDVHSLPLPGTLPAGEYGLRVYVRSADGRENEVLTDTGQRVPVNQLPVWPLLVRPQQAANEGTKPIARFENGIELLGATLPGNALTSGQWLRFSLLWRTSQPVDQEVTVFTQLVDTEGRVVAQRDNPPRGGTFPFRLMPVGEVVSDDYALPLDFGLSPGSYSMIVGLYFSDTVERIVAADDHGGTADSVGVGDIRLGPAD